jgi:hypothetical protein
MVFKTFSSSRYEKSPQLCCVFLSISAPPAAAPYERAPGKLTTTTHLQRNLNNAFAYDLVPSPSVVVAALKAARRVNDFATAVRIFEGTS